MFIGNNVSAAQNGAVEIAGQKSKNGNHKLPDLPESSRARNNVKFGAQEFVSFLCFLLIICIHAS
jgi:hypothetical protein